MLNGIDVSVHNGSIDWNKVKNSGKVDFAIIRAGYGKVASQKDPKFEYNYKFAKDAGLKVGLYWYSYATSVSDAKAEAKVCLECIGKPTLDLPIYYDIEDKKTLNLGKDKVSKIAETFLTEIEKAGYKGGIYTSKSVMETLISDDIKNKYSVWVAHVGKSGAALKTTSYKGEKDIWQYSWKGKIDGISGDVDLDHCYLNLDTAKKAEAKAETKTEARKSVAELAKEVIAGKWGNGADRKKALISAGYSYDDVQAEVNKLVGTRKTVTHTVRQGDTLSALSRRYGTTVMKIVADNKRTYPRISPNYIVVGWNLTIN